jgi:hypothetical protein
VVSVEAQKLAFFGEPLHGLSQGRMFVCMLGTGMPSIYNLLSGPDEREGVFTQNASCV